MCCLLIAPTLRAQDVTEPALKAAFVYNMAKFIEWPPEVLPDAAVFTVCVLNDRQFGEEFERTVSDRLFGGHRIAVRRVAPDGLFRSCHVLYASGITAAQVMAIDAALAGAPVLTIGDTDHFVQDGGIARLFLQNGRLRFEVNLRVARRNRLQINARLLALAARVVDGPPGGRP